MLKLDIKKAITEIKKKNAKTVILQLPEGLKGKTLEIIERIEGKTKAKVIAVMDPVWGACDLAETEMKEFNADLLIHLGHAKYTDSKIKVVYVPLEYSVKEINLDKIQRMLENEKIKKVGLLCAVQFYNILKEIEKGLKKKKFTVLLEKGGEKIDCKGQVLGCDQSSAVKIEKKVDGFLYIGDGFFHPLGVAVSTDKKVLAFNPLNGEIKDLVEEKNIFVRKRYGSIARAMNAKVFGILVSRKKGQLRKELALELKKRIERKGKKAFIFSMDFIKSEYLMGINIDCYVNTACPRIIEDNLNDKPVLNPEELFEVLEKI
ncbi:MAG: diphthamide biosynthesis enzyme Dph2 [Candidatus Diapherotrites archaeon CG10_big_fil_rev_8_21_14_0_10_31_34]|nr:MAG: diphthamide biosynthesis enzyme Dph2 [Candidatus Diapherotrites archaeon CG10_big_fil_rev_8_21_14_0_10_31_34]